MGSPNDQLPTPLSPNKEFGTFGSFSIKPPTAPKIYTCTVCNQSFNRSHNLKSHKATHSATKPFQCEECSKPFLRLHDLKRHQKLHTGEKPFGCPECGRYFSRLDALNRHRKTEGCQKTWPIQLPQPPPAPSEPLPFIQSTDEIERLRQKVHDLEIENRVLRSLLCKDNNNEESNSKRQRTP